MHPLPRDPVEGQGFFSAFSNEFPLSPLKRNHKKYMQNVFADNTFNVTGSRGIGFIGFAGISRQNAAAAIRSQLRTRCHSSSMMFIKWIESPRQCLCPSNGFITWGKNVKDISATVYISRLGFLRGRFVFQWHFLNYGDAQTPSHFQMQRSQLMTNMAWWFCITNCYYEPLSPT